jgi:hypothetical protein
MPECLDCQEGHCELCTGLTMDGFNCACYMESHYGLCEEEDFDYDA